MKIDLNFPDKRECVKCGARVHKTNQTFERNGKKLKEVKVSYLCSNCGWDIEFDLEED